MPNLVPFAAVKGQDPRLPNAFTIYSIKLPEGEFRMQIPEDDVFAYERECPGFCERLKAMAIEYGCTVWFLRYERAWLIERTKE